MSRLILITLFLAGVAFAAPLNLLGKQIKTKDINTTFTAGKIYVLMFGANWCPPCEYSKTIIDEAKEKFKIESVYVDTDKINIQDFKNYTLQTKIPLVLVTDKNGTVIKRFEAKLKRDTFLALIKRVSENRLENGTLPIEERVDSWKKSRYDK